LLHRKTTAVALFIVFFVVCIWDASALCQDSPGAVPDSFQGFKAIVVGDVCNLRAGPGTTYPRVGQVIQGTWLDIVFVENNWVKIRYKNKQAWIASWLVDIDLGSRAINARITRTDVNVRQGPGTNFPVIFLTQRGRIFPAEAKRGEWIRVSLGNGKTGWIHGSLLQLELPSLLGSEKSRADILVFPAERSIKIWQTPIQGSTVLGSLQEGQSARYITSRGAWIAVETSDGTKGWVYGPQARIYSLKDPSLSFGVSESSWSIGKYKTVTVTATDVNFRSGPGTNYPVLTMVDRGDVLRVIQTQDRWINAVSPRGVVGWIASWLTSGVDDKFLAFSVTVDASQSSRILTVTGPFESSRIISENDGYSLRVSTSVFFNTEGCLDINCFEFESIQVATSDVTIKFKEKPWYVVREQSPGRVVIEFSPTITSIAMHAQEDSDVLTINTLGYAWPDVTRNGNSLSFFLPGASYSGHSVEFQGRLVRSIDLLPQDGGLTLALNTLQNTPYLLKKTANSLQAYFPLPGLAGKIIVIDPGHGGNDPGAIGPTGVTERSVNWEIAERLAHLLQQSGAIVQLTRRGPHEDATAPSNWNPGPDEYAGDLAKRVAWSRNAHVFISIHNDYHYNRDISGTTSYICKRTLNSSESWRLASLIQKELSAALGTVDRGVRDSNFFVTREALCPSVLVEVMYLSNLQEEQLLKHPQTFDKAAHALYRALQQYFSPKDQKAI